MAGTIVADDIQHSTAGSVGTEYVVNGAAKSWIDFNGQGTVAIQDSFNFSSVTDNGTGHYITNTSITMSGARYSCVVGGSLYGEPRFQNAHSYTSTSQRVRTANAGSSQALDWEFIHLANFGDLA